jgi:streptogramin lyase
MRECVVFVVAIAVAACSGSSNAKSGGDAASAGGSRDSTAQRAVAATPGDSACPAMGLWAQCAVMYRLERAGLAPHLDSTGKVEEKSIGQGATSFVVKVGMLARLEVFLYPDSAARIADGVRLDRKEFVGATQEQTIKRERTLIENANLVGLLTSLNSHQRERVSDALTAGPPQPATR